MTRLYPSLRDRLDAWLAPCPDDGCQCLLWGGFINEDGYGLIRINHKTYRVHRIAWALDNGLIPDGLTIDHVKAWGCNHRHCANVAHLEPVTRRENTMRGDSIPAANAAKTHCGHGHLFDTANTHRDKQGHRCCRACWRQRKSLD